MSNSLDWNLFHVWSSSTKVSNDKIGTFDVEAQNFPLSFEKIKLFETISMNVLDVFDIFDRYLQKPIGAIFSMKPSEIVQFAGKKMEGSFFGEGC